MRFKTLLVDSPWDFQTYSKTGQHRSPENHYPVMTLDRLKALPLRDISEKDAVLLMWACNPLLTEAMDLMTAWGFKYKTKIEWVKLVKDGVHLFGYGNPKPATGYHARGCTEPLLIGTRGTPKVPPPDKRPLGVIMAPAREHSRKPDQQYTISEGYEGPYVEIFARPHAGLPRPGWTHLGNEIDQLDVFDAIERLKVM